ncbi:MFS transporter [Paenibacillus caui]|uniref:MFS transporter n=1 Tax=Paenibacillus caui TaxID=2873927 RepID=UPI001CA9D49F|nr:MFS transporter [Paenibacillus caui]
MEQVLVQSQTAGSSLGKNKDYLLLLLAKMISRFGDSIDAIAYSWIVYMLTGSKLLMGTLFAVNSIPAIVLSIFTGVFVDRWSTKVIVICADYGRGLLVFVTGLLYMTGRLEVWHLFLFTLLISSFEAFASPAENSWIPRILPKFLLLKGNSLSSSMAQTAELVGLAAAGGIVVLIGNAGALWVDAATFLCSAVILTFVSSGRADAANPATALAETAVPDQAATSGKPSAYKAYIIQLKEGFSYVRGNLLIFTSIILAALVNFCLAPINALQIVYVKDLLHAGPGGLSMLGICLTCGMILSGLAIAKWGDRFRKSTLILSAILLMGICLALLSLPPALPGIYALAAAAGLMSLLGASVSLASAPLRSYVMEVTPGHMLGRISALISMMCLSAVPLGGTLTGLVADLVPIPHLYAIIGSVIALLALGLFNYKAFRSI